MERQPTATDAGTWMIVGTAHGTYLAHIAGTPLTSPRGLDMNQAFDEVHEVATQLVPGPVPNNPKAVSIAKECFITPVYVTSHPTKMTISLAGAAITMLSDMAEMDRDFYMMMLDNSRNMHKGWQANRSKVQLATVSDLTLVKGS